jgi:hypothetical protein
MNKLLKRLVLIYLCLGSLYVFIIGLFSSGMGVPVHIDNGLRER